MQTAELVSDLKRDSDFDHDSSGMLLYWDSTTGLHLLLEPAKPITDPNLVIGKVGQQNLLPGHFTMKPKDLETTQIASEEGRLLGQPIPPGISSFLFFGSRESRQHDLDSISQCHLGRSAHWKNRMYISQIKEIQKAGWEAYFAPLINRAYPIYNPLHVLLVPNSMARAAILMDATEEEKIAISQAFIRWNC